MVKENRYATCWDKSMGFSAQPLIMKN